jgi:hypothetical protein
MRDLKQPRQGDILLLKCEQPRGDREEVARDARGRLILAEGEATGHAHAIAAKAAALVIVAGMMYLHLEEQAQWVHEEHAPIDLPPGWYEVRRKREYSPEEVRWVTD